MLLSKSAQFFHHTLPLKASDIKSNSLTMPIEPLINLSEILTLSANITLAPTHSFSF